MSDLDHSLAQGIAGLDTTAGVPNYLVEDFINAIWRVQVLCDEHIEVRDGDTLQRPLLPEQVLKALHDGQDVLRHVGGEWNPQCSRRSPRPSVDRRTT